MAAKTRWVRRKRTAEERWGGTDNERPISAWVWVLLTLAIGVVVALLVVKPEPRVRDAMPRVAVELNYSAFPCVDTWKMGSALICSVGREQFEKFGPMEQRSRAEETLTAAAGQGFKTVVLISREDGKHLATF